MKDTTAEAWGIVGVWVVAAVVVGLILYALWVLPWWAIVALILVEEIL